MVQCLVTSELSVLSPTVRFVPNGQSEMIRCSAPSNGRNGRPCGVVTHQQFPFCGTHLTAISGLQIKRSKLPGVLGKGLFYVGERDFPSGKEITRFSSKEITRANISGDYVLQIKEKYCLDGSGKLNYPGRYINSNHNTNLQPNVRWSHRTAATKITIGDETRYYVSIISLGVIKPGTELLIDYGKHYKLPQN